MSLWHTPTPRWIYDNALKICQIETVLFCKILNLRNRAQIYTTTHAEQSDKCPETSHSKNKTMKVDPLMKKS